MKYAVGFFGGRVWMVNPHSMISSAPYPSVIHVTEGELFKGKGWAFLYIHTTNFVENYPKCFDRAMRKPSMTKLPWKIFGQKEGE